MAENDESKPKIIVDDDWKAQAKAEKQKLVEEQVEQPKSQPAGPAKGDGKRGEIPPANFETLVTSIATQALFAMGAVADPQTNRRYVNLDVARHQIDMLKLLESKTAGNLTEEEKQVLDRTLYELRTHYVQIAQRASQG